MLLRDHRRGEYERPPGVEADIAGQGDRLAHFEVAPVNAGAAYDYPAHRYKLASIDGWRRSL
jgi:hypothetical protein